MLQDYSVWLVESGISEEIVFECQAEDSAHAIEQAENAYPGCKINYVELS